MEPLPEIWASHGRENRRLNGAILVKDPSENQIRGISMGVEACRSASGAFRLEEKPFSIALHVRGISDLSASKILKEAQVVWRPIARAHDLEILHFDGGIELRAAGWTKGDAVNALLKDSPQDAAVAYLGDDETDEDAFKALGNSGLPILVRHTWRNTAARAWLRPPKELLGFLERWLEANV
jgi:trehalose-phosphatase